MHRHNSVRDIIYELARRARVDPQLERAGLIVEAGMFLELRRPADVLAQLARDPATAPQGLAPTESVALDVKVTNARGPDHCATGDTPDAQAALARCARVAENLNGTAAAHGVTYRPLVLSAQGGRSLVTDY